ncbi:acyl-CoA thioesterase [Nocardia asteroides]|uniref:acyl-CoA thioesterase n=1 Tax=Nocardia asteroides TaxID=1824 RepID=UPI0033CF63DB
MIDPEYITISLRWRDTDQLGHVYHASLVSLLDEARSRWIQQSGIDAMNFVVAHLDITYKQEIVIDDAEIRVDVEISRIGTASLDTREVISTKNGICAKCESTLVRWDPATRASTPMTEHERKAALGTINDSSFNPHN